MGTPSWDYIRGAMAHHVLVVDDEPDITALVAYHLAKAGYHVTTAVSGPEALPPAGQEGDEREAECLKDELRDRGKPERSGSSPS